MLWGIMGYDGQGYYSADPYRNLYGNRYVPEMARTSLGCADANSPCKYIKPYLPYGLLALGAALFLGVI